MSCLTVFIPYFFIACNIGETVTAAYAQLNESIYNIAWYKCQMENQKYIVPMILMAEKPFRLPVYASFDCSRDTFKSVNVSNFSNSLSNSIGSLLALVDGSEGAFFLCICHF